MKNILIARRQNAITIISNRTSLLKPLIQITIIMKKARERDQDANYNLEMSKSNKYCGERKT